MREQRPADALHHALLPRREAVKQERRRNTLIALVKTIRNEQDSRDLFAPGRGELHGDAAPARNVTARLDSGKFAGASITRHASLSSKNEPTSRSSRPCS